MACIIYREGKGTVEFGIECESTTCEVEHLDGLLAAGWSQNPPGYKAATIEIEAADEPEDATINPVRIAAKAAGIDGWDIKRIGTLEKLLSEA